jgi:hypothetical protein
MIITRKVDGSCEFRDHLARFRDRHPGVSRDEARRIVTALHGAESGAGRTRTSKLTVNMPAQALADLRHEARRRGIDAGEFAASILCAVVADQLFAAVIDR